MAPNPSRNQPASAYAFSAPSASISSDQQRQRELNTFHNPLLSAITSTNPSSRPQSPGLVGPRSPRTPNNNNPFGDQNAIFQRNNQSYPSRSNSPIGHESPNASLLNKNNNSNMAPPSTGAGNQGRGYGPRPGGGGQMPPRGESSTALLPEMNYRNSPQSPARRYGPTASAAPVSSSQALLSPASSVSDNKPPFSQNGSSRSDMHNSNSNHTDISGYGGLDAGVEADDYLHNPDPKRDRKSDHGGTIFTTRGFVNIGCLTLVLICLITLFAGYPIIIAFTERQLSTNGGYNLGGINATGQVPYITNFKAVIDPDTPKSAYTRTGFDGLTYNLAFSDEFNKDGRTFYPGDDPYFTAVDLHYWPTGDFEWYDPSAITTSGGNLVITMNQESIHDLNFKSGMLQSWNQLCFQYSAYIEVSVSLPGTAAVGGFWPGVWMMGNLGRPGYGATTEGTWPYTYAACDIGALANQTNAAQTGPSAALSSAQNGGGALSFLPGQRLSACTCAGEDHPGPDVKTGRGAPEIDAIEAQTDLSIPQGQVSQSFQVAPFDAEYWPYNTSTDSIQYDTSKTIWNTYRGGPYQQAVSSLTYVNNANYQLTNGGFATYGFEYFANPNNRAAGYITWQTGGVKSWTMYANAVRANPLTQISQRIIPEEPMALVFNFGMSNNFQTVDFSHLTWPAKMLIDYVRVYQTSAGRMGCDPADRPTAAYINRHAEAYNNPNLTTWAQAGQTFPRTTLKDGCSQ